MNPADFCPGCEYHTAETAAQHFDAVGSYARGIYDAWTVHHGVFRRLIDRVQT